MTIHTKILSSIHGLWYNLLKTAQKTLFFINVFLTLILDNNNYCILVAI